MENVKILHRPQFLLAKVSSLSLNSSHLSPFYQVLICKIHVFPQLNQFWDSLQSDIAHNGSYASIGGMNLQLSELQDNDKKIKVLRAGGLPEGWEEVEGVLQYRGLPYVPEIIRSKVISCYHNDSLAEHFGIDKTRELVGWKYYWPSLRKDVKNYVRGFDVCLASKAIRYKPYRDLQSLPVPTHRWKDLSMDFMTGLPLFADWKNNSYDLILIIVDRLTKMVHYELVKVTINASGLAKVIINVVVRHHDLLDSIVNDRGAIFTSKFWSSLCYFLDIKRRLFTAFHPQTDGQMERQNSTMEAYFRAFVNWEQNDWARLLLMAEFAYNNFKNASTGHTPFELNCGYHPRMSYEEEVDPRSQSKSADELSEELRELIVVCRENLHHAQELQKRAHDKGVKPRSYAPGEKVWLNSKFIKTKRNRKLEAKFFGPFRVLHPVGKQAYKLELPKKWRIHDVFHMSLLEQDTTRKGWEFSVPEFELEPGDDKEYEVEAIRDSAVYAKEADGHLPGLYYLVAWKGYPEEENTWEPSLAVMHLRKMVSTFHKDYPEKSTATSAPLDFALSMAKPTTQLPAKQKRGRPLRRAKKHAKWSYKEEATRRNPSQCGSKSQKPAGGQRSVSLVQGASKSLQWQFDHWQFNS